MIFVVERQIGRREFIDVLLSVRRQHCHQSRDIGIVAQQQTPSFPVIGTWANRALSIDNLPLLRRLRGGESPVWRRLPLRLGLARTRSIRCRRRFVFLLCNLQENQAEPHEQETERGREQRNAQQKTADQQHPSCNTHRSTVTHPCRNPKTSGRRRRRFWPSVTVAFTQERRPMQYSMFNPGRLRASVLFAARPWWKRPAASKRPQKVENGIPGRSDFLPPDPTGQHATAWVHASTR